MLATLKASLHYTRPLRATRQARSMCSSKQEQTYDSWDTPLDLAAQGGHADIVQRFIRQGARLNARDADGQTVLHKVAFENKPDVIDALVAAGAEVDAVLPESGFTPLHVASMHGCSEAACSLLKHGASISTRDSSGRNPLHLASDGESCGIINTLLEGGADKHTLSGDGQAPLHVAATRGSVAVTQALLAAGAYVNLPLDKDGSSALSIAALNGHADVVELLIRRGADLGATDNRGSTVLHQAASKHRAGVVDVLFKAGASIEALDRDLRTPLAVAFHAFGRSRRKDAHAAIVVLLKHGANANMRIHGNHGDPLLLCAAEVNSVPAVEALLAAGADVNGLDDGANFTEKLTALHVSAKHNHPGVLKALLRNAADTEMQTLHGRTPLHVAAKGGHVKSIDALVDGGAKVDVQDENGRTPLHIACANLECSTIHALLRSGADIQAVDSCQYSPLHCAVRRIEGRDSVFDVAHSVNLLLRWGADENAVDWHGKSAGGILQEYSANHWLPDPTLVRLLVSTAPQDKAWRRRGWLVLCRARPNRIWLKAKDEGSSTRISTRNVRPRDAGMWARFDTAAKLQQGAEGGMTPRERDAAAGGLGGLLAAVLGA
ncbi:unnamed protein product, partial [Ectocarpus fasciculatus]